MKKLDNYTIRELSKKISGTDILPSSSSISFVYLAELLIKQLQNGADLERINRITTSELISSYGLDVTENDSVKIAEDVCFWYHE